VGTGIDCLAIEDRLYARQDPGWDLLGCKLSGAGTAVNGSFTLADYVALLDGGAQPAGSLPVRVAVEHRWGKSSFACDPDSWLLLKAVATADMTGYEALAWMNRNGAKEFSDVELRSLILALRRLGAIGITA
jgi:hypothetical protein